MTNVDSTPPIAEKQKHYMLYCKFVPDMLTARLPFMEAHMNILKKMSSNGLVFVGMELTEGFPGTFMFEGETDDVVKNWMSIDPYFTNGLVMEHHYNEIKLVAGKMVDQLKV